MDGITGDARRKLMALATRRYFEGGETVFLQGQPHNGVWIILNGRLRTFYVGPSGREITLAYWSAGHFAGGPEVFGRGLHIWSADAVEQTETLHLPGAAIRSLVTEVPEFSVAVIEGLIAKGKCYSALIQMLGTRSVSERLEQFLLILAQTTGRPDGAAVIIDRSITYEQIANIVGATRQWVTKSIDRLESAGTLEVSRQHIRINDLRMLSNTG